METKRVTFIWRLLIVLTLPIFIIAIFKIIALAEPENLFPKEKFTNINFNHFLLDNYFENELGWTTSGITNIEMTNNGGFWLGTNYGICYFDGESCIRRELSNTDFEYLNFIESLKYNSITSTLWVGTSGEGVKVLSGEDWTSYNTDNSGLIDNSINVIAFDNLGRVWIGTSKGISIFDGRTWISVTPTDSDISDEEITEITFDNNGFAWVGTWDKKLRIARLKILEISLESENIINSFRMPSQVLEISFDEDGQAWIATYDRLFLIDNELNIIETPLLDLLNSNTHVNVIAFDSMERPWLGMMSIGETENLAIIYDKELYVFTEMITDFSPESVWDIEIDSQGIVWLATSYGLYKVSENIPLPITFDEATNYKEIIDENLNEYIQYQNYLQFLIFPIGIIWAFVLVLNIRRSTQIIINQSPSKRKILGKWVRYGVYSGIVNFGYISLVISLIFLLNVFVIPYSILAAPLIGLTYWISGAILTKNETIYSKIKLIGLSIIALILWVLPYVIIGVFIYSFLSAF